MQLKQRAIEVMVDEGQVDLARPAITLAAAALTQPEPESTPPSDLAHRAPADSEPQVFMSLTQGQSASFNQDQQQMRQLAHNQLLQQQAWRRGLLIFADTPLSQVIEEIGRYTPVTIEIVDPELNNLALGGRFRIGELDALFDVLEAGFGIQISYIDQEHIQLRQFKH